MLVSGEPVRDGCEGSEDEETGDDEELRENLATRSRVTVTKSKSTTAK